MDGKELKYQLRQLLNEDSGSGFLDDKTSYMYLWEAAREFVSRVRILTSTQSITTVADQTGYTLNADMLEPFLENTDKKLILKYNDGTTDHWLAWKNYHEIIYENNTTSVSIPSSWAVIDDTTLDSKISSTTTSAGAASGGQCTLTDTAADFSDVSAGDIVHNATDGSDGIVLSKTSTTVLVVALFGGTDNDWTSGDSYIIQPRGRFKLYLNPPPSTAGHTITFYYVQSPPPVFSDYGIYRFPSEACHALVKYAAWLYKYRDKEPQLGDSFYKYFDMQARKLKSIYDRSINKNELSVSFRKR